MKRIIVICCMFAWCSQSFAEGAYFPSRTTVRKPYVTFGLGDMLYRVGNTNSLNSGTGWPNDRYLGNNISNQPYFLLGTGYTWKRPRMYRWLPSYSLGLRYMYVRSASISGNIDQYSLPQFQNYSYSYDVQLSTLTAVVKADIYRWRKLMPYLTLGAGIARATTSDYSEQANQGVTPRVSPGFSGNSSNNFTYLAGVGVDYMLKKDWWASLECNYTNFGTVSTGKGANYSTLTGVNYDSDHLKNTISATSVFLSITYYPALQ